MSATAADRTYKAIRLDVEGSVATITLARPEARNALNDQMKADLGDAIRVIAGDDSVRAVILTGEGTAFCSGGDIKEMKRRTAIEVRTRMANLLATVTIPLARLEKPVIAAINGHAHGAGISLAASTDLIIAAEDATFSLAFVRVGLIPDMGALYFLPRLIGLNRAKEMIFTGSRLSAQEACELGLVNRVVPTAEVLSVATELATSLSEGPTIMLGLAKRMIDQASHLSLEDIAQLEAYGQAVVMSTPDHAEGVAAYLEKRATRFTGRRSMETITEGDGNGE